MYSNKERYPNDRNGILFECKGKKPIKKKHSRHNFITIVEKSVDFQVQRFYKL